MVGTGNVVASACGRFDPPMQCDTNSRTECTCHTDYHEIKSKNKTRRRRSGVSDCMSSSWHSGKRAGHPHSCIVCLIVTYCHHQALRIKQQRAAEREVDGVETNPAYTTTTFSPVVKTNPNPAYTTTAFNQDMKTDHNPVYASNYARPDHQHCDAPGDPRQAAVIDSKLYAEPDLTTMSLDLTSEENFNTSLSLFSR